VRRVVLGRVVLELVLRPPVQLAQHVEDEVGLGFGAGGRAEAERQFRTGRGVAVVVPSVPFYRPRGARGRPGSSEVELNAGDPPSPRLPVVLGSMAATCGDTRGGATPPRHRQSVLERGIGPRH
jgi:hypothetical protein